MTELPVGLRGRRAPGTLLGFAAFDASVRYRAAQRRARWRRVPGALRALRTLRFALTALALATGLWTFAAGTAQAGVFDDTEMKIVNLCNPNAVPVPRTAAGLDSDAGLNTAPSDPAVRATVMPNFKGYAEAEGGAVQKLTAIYSTSEAQAASLADPQYQRYGFSALQWSTYAPSCGSMATVMAPINNGLLQVLVIGPVMLAMMALHLAMSDTLYTGFATLIQPFITAMYDVLNPWIYAVVPIGVLITWAASRGSLQATVKATAWGVTMLAVFLLMGSSTSQLVTASTNIVTEVAGTAACKINAAGTAAEASSPYSSPADDTCDGGPADASINQAIWQGTAYQTWSVGQVGSEQAAKDRTAKAEGSIGISQAILNAQHLGTDENGNIDDSGKTLLDQTDRWNEAGYTAKPDELDTKLHVWGTNNAWSQIPYLSVVKVICNDTDTADSDATEEGTSSQRWAYTGARGTTEGDVSNYCDSTTPGAKSTVAALDGSAYSEQTQTALIGGLGALTVGVAVGIAGGYLAVQKMLFFFLLFLAPVILLVASIGDEKRRPFAIRYAELIGANLLKQIAAVCVVLFISHAISSLMSLTGPLATVPWVLKPFVVAIFVIALALLALPSTGMLKGAVKGDVSSVDRAAQAPARAVKTLGKGAALATAAVATGGTAAALASGGMSAGTAAGTLGKAGAVLGKTGMIAGRGKAGTILRRAGHLAKAGEAVIGAQANAAGKRAAMNEAANHLLSNPKTRQKYLDADGQLKLDARKRAMRDAESMTRDGELAATRARAHERQLAAFASQVQATSGTPFTDPRNSTKRNGPQRAGMPVAPSTTGPEAGPRAQGESKDTDLSTVANDAHTQGQATNGEGQQGTREQKQGVPFGAPGTGADGGTPSLAESYEHYAKQARNNLDMPVHARNMAYTQAGRVEGDEVLDAAQMSLSDAVAHPDTLLSGDAYSGGDTTKMDPFHAATGAMMQLRFASASGDADAIEKAMNDASTVIADHGVPAQMSGMHAIGDQAAAFNPVALMGAMPNIGTDTSMVERADAAQTMMAAAVSMPADYGARNEVMAYTEALATPTVDPGTLDVLRDQAIGAMQTAHGGEQPLVAPEDTPPTPMPVLSGGPAAPPAAPSATGPWHPESDEPTPQEGRPPADDDTSATATGVAPDDSTPWAAVTVPSPTEPPHPPHEHTSPHPESAEHPQTTATNREEAPMHSHHEHDPDTPDPAAQVPELDPLIWPIPDTPRRIGPAYYPRRRRRRSPFFDSAPEGDASTGAIEPDVDSDEETE